MQKWIYDSPMSVLDRYSFSPPRRSASETSTAALHLLLLLVPLSALGCSDRLDSAQVSGKVLMKDGSVPQGGVRVVQFVPAKDSTAEIRKGASGEIRDDGSFVAYTRKPGDGV